MRALRPVELPAAVEEGPKSPSDNLLDSEDWLPTEEEVVKQEDVVSSRLVDSLGQLKEVLKEYKAIKGYQPATDLIKGA